MHPTIPPAPSPPDAGRYTVSSRFGGQSGACGCRVRGQWTARYRAAVPRRILLMEPQVWSIPPARRSTVRPRVAASHDRRACASSLLLCPHTYPLALRLAFPHGRRTGLPCSVSVTREWVRRALSTGSVAAHDKEGGSPCTRSSALLAQAWQHLWRVFGDDVSRAFTWVRPTIHPRPVSVSGLTDVSSPHGCDASQLAVGALSGGSVRVVTFPHISVGYR